MKFKRNSFKRNHDSTIKKPPRSASNKNNKSFLIKRQIHKKEVQVGGGGIWIDYGMEWSEVNWMDLTERKSSLSFWFQFEEIFFY